MELQELLSQLKQILPNTQLEGIIKDVVNVEGKSLRYNLPTVKNPHFIAISNMKLIDLFVNKL